MPVQTVSVQQEQTVNQQVRDQIVLENLFLVKAIAIRERGRLPAHVDLDDLVNAGVLGLLDAATKYTTDNNVPFPAYAKHRIKGALLDSLRKQDWASRDLRRQQKKAEATAQDLSMKLGRAPSEIETAAEMGIDIDRLRRTRMELRTVGVVSMTPVSNEERSYAEDTRATPDLEPDRMCERRQLQGIMARAIRKLPVRYQKVIVLYYTNDLNMKEIGKRMGVNESRVSQIHKMALKKMETMLQSEGIQSAAAL